MDPIKRLVSLTVRMRPAAPPSTGGQVCVEFANGGSESIRLLEQVGSFSRVSASQREGSSPLSLAVANKLNGLEPLRWLSDTLEKLPTCPNSRIDFLLPFAQSTVPDYVPNPERSAE